MNKIKKIIFSLFFIILFLYINCNNIFAASNGHVGGATTPGACGGNYCYSNEVGVRITIVNRYGDRCYYDQPNNKITCGPSVKDHDIRENKNTDNVDTAFSLSVDYWFTDGDILLTPGNCWQYKSKYTKKEFTQSSILRDFKDVAACNLADTWGDATDYKLTWLFFGDSYNSKHHTDIKTKNGGWKIISNNNVSKIKEPGDVVKINTYRNPENIYNIIDYLECITLDSSSKKFGTNTSLTADECSLIRSSSQKENNIAIFNRMFRNAFKNQSFDVRNVSLVDSHTRESVYIQMDEIVAFTSYGVRDVDDYTFKGTVAEVAYLYSFYNNHVGNLRWGLLSNGSEISDALDANTNLRYIPNQVTYDSGHNTSSGICTNVFDGWSNQTCDGVSDQCNEYSIIKSDQLAIPLKNSNADSGVYCFIRDDGRIQLKPTPKNWLWYRYGRVDTRNVVAYWIKPNAFGDCNTDARNVINSSSYLSNTNWKKKLFDSSSNIRNKCFSKTDTFDASSFKDTQCYQLNPDYIKHIGIAPNKKLNGSVIDICEPLNCQDTLFYSTKVNTHAYISQKVANKPYIEEVSGESDLSTNYDKSIYYLYHTTNKGWNFSDFGDLNYYNYRGMYNKPAECKVTPTVPISVESSCDESSSVVFEDSNECSSGVAYTDNMGSNGQTSYDSHYDIEQNVPVLVYNDDGTIALDANGIPKVEYKLETKPGYCSEKVKFEFPQSPSLVKAGQVLKWGIDTSKDNDSFGTMTVEKTCHYPSADSNAIDSNAKEPCRIFLYDILNLNPDIRLNYEEPLPNIYNGDSNYYDREYRSVHNIGSNLTSIEMKAVAEGIDISKNEDVLVKNLETHGIYNNIKRDNSPGDKITLTAHYKIVYTNKLKWYYDKASNEGYLKDKETIGSSADTDARYIFLGYGIPISLESPTNIYSKELAEANSEVYENGKSFGYDINNTSVIKKGALYIGLKSIGSRNNKNSTDDSAGFHFDKFISYGSTDTNAFKNGYLVYSCGFSIKNDLFGTEYGDSKCVEDMNCNETRGLDVVFRTVELVDNETSLNKAFPGRTGTGRADDRGANWKKISDDKVAKLLSTTVYDYEPMYHIELTPSKIKQIRVDNKKLRDKEYDPYSYMGEFVASISSTYNTYDFKKYDSEASVTYDLSLIDLKDEYTYATSKYLTDLTDEDYGLDGTCMITNRLVRHANTQGCYPWSMIYDLNSE